MHRVRELLGSYGDRLDQEDLDQLWVASLVSCAKLYDIKIPTFAEDGDEQEPPSVNQAINHICERREIEAASIEGFSVYKMSRDDTAAQLYKSYRKFSLLERLDIPKFRPELESFPQGNTFVLANYSKGVMFALPEYIAACTQIARVNSSTEERLEQQRLIIDRFIFISMAKDEHRSGEYRVTVSPRHRKQLLDSVNPNTITVIVEDIVSSAHTTMNILLPLLAEAFENNPDVISSLRLEVNTFGGWYFEETDSAYLWWDQVDENKTNPVRLLKSDLRKGN
jgi:hypothetical protein